MLRALNRMDREKTREGKKFVEDNFDWKNIVKNFEKELEAVVNP